MILTTLATAALLQTIAFTSVAQGAASRIDEPRKVIARSAEEFQAIWKAHSSAPLPKVDFSSSIVVGVFLGMRPTAGFTAHILRVTRSGSGAVVEYVEGTPDPSRMFTQVLTSPFHLVRIPRDSQTIEFKQVSK